MHRRAGRRKRSLKAKDFSENFHFLLKAKKSERKKLEKKVVYGLLFIKTGEKRACQLSKEKKAEAAVWIEKNIF